MHSPTSWFDDAVDAYERARPSYPDALFDDLFARIGVPADAGAPRVVEVGAGTGKATASLLARGADVTAIELGGKLAAFLRQKFAGQERLRVINEAFESAPLDDGAYDAVVAATSYGWMDKGTRTPRSHDLLRAGGVLAVIGTEQIASPADRGYFERSQVVYRKYFPDEEITPTPGEDVVPWEYDELSAIGLFGAVELRRYRCDQTYPTDVYADLVRSYSNTAQMAPEPREALIADLSRLIDEEFDGYVVRPIVFTLVMGVKGSGG